MTDRRSGSAIVETAAALAIVVPLLLVITYFASQASRGFLIKSGLDAAARRAARDLAVVYATNTGIASNRAQQDAIVLDRIRIAGVIANSKQFYQVQFRESETPPTVTVAVSYPDNKFGLTPFPDPDPFALSSKIRLTSSSTYRSITQS